MESELREAYRYAAKYSEDARTQVGARLEMPGYAVMSANRLPPRADKRLVDAPYKYWAMEHAERGVIYEAARRGNCTAGATLYAPWYACPDCARAIILAGITEVVGHADALERTPSRWMQKIADAHKLLKWAGVKQTLFRGPIGGVEIMFNGELWRP